MIPSAVIKSRSNELQIQGLRHGLQAARLNQIIAHAWTSVQPPPTSGEQTLEKDTEHRHCDHLSFSFSSIHTQSPAIIVKSTFGATVTK